MTKKYQTKEEFAQGLLARCRDTSFANDSGLFESIVVEELEKLKDCKACCKQRKAEADKAAHLYDKLDRKKDKLNSQLATVESHGCMVFLITLTALVVAALSICYIPTDKVKWVDQDLNIIRYQDKIYRCTEVKRPFIDVKQEKSDD